MEGGSVLSNSEQFWCNDYLNDNHQIIPRCYTFISNFDIDDSFLCINKDFMYQSLIRKEDKILAEWVTFDELNYFFFIYVLVDSTQTKSEERNELLTPQIINFIEALRHSEQTFFNENPLLLYSSIYVFFHSKHPHLDRIEQWGNFSNY